MRHYYCNDGECKEVGATIARGDNRWLLSSRLSMLRKPGEKGIGDTVARIFAKFGGDKFKWVFKQLNINCGCEDRQKALNERFPYDV